MPSKENDIWEKEAFDHATYVTLFNYLPKGNGSSWIWPDQRQTLADLIIKQSGLVRLVAIAAYFETLSFSRIEEAFPDEVFMEARHSLRDFMRPDQPDWPRAVALLRPFAKHEKLRESVLIGGVIDSFLRLLDHIIGIPGEHFAHVMDALCSLIELHPDPTVNKLVESSGRASRRDRLSLMLDMDDPSHLTAVLRVIISLAQQAPFLCLKLKPRLHELAKSRQGPIGLWAVQALVEVSRAEAIQEPGEQLLISSTQLEYLHASNANVSPARNWMRIGDSLLYRIFSAGPLGNTRRKFIERLLIVADGRDIRARTAATFTLLRLHQVSDNLSTYLQDQGLQGVLVRQLQFKDSALLAAYALTRCLTHEEFGNLMNDRPHIVGYIVNMIRLDYFDEAIGITQGFTIFEDLMRCGKLKLKLLGYDITSLLERKLGAGTPRGTRTGLIYLNIFRVHGEYSLTRNLVERGMSRLRTNKWRTQKAGTAILCSLAKTCVCNVIVRVTNPSDVCAGFGAEALKSIVPEVVDMLLPMHDPDTQRAGDLPASRRYKPPSSLLGPAFVMRVFAENDIRQTVQYRRLRHLYLFGDLLGAQETPIWQVRTPTRDDVLDVINQMIKSVDSVQGSTNAGFTLPHIRHWHRITRVFRDGVVEVIMLPAAFAGIAALAVVGAIVLAPVYLSRRIGRLIERPWRLSRQDAIIRSLKLPDSESPVATPSAAPRVNLTDNQV
ncbi:hypothetical protein JVU11DRAFT_3903 [Chiua virens]|nr:hypothetical protein JVU11DRAFT_3903 [Chiua virens]